MPSVSFTDPSDPRYTLVADFDLDESKLPGRPPPRLHQEYFRILPFIRISTFVRLSLCTIYASNCPMAWQGLQYLGNRVKIIQILSLSLFQPAQRYLTHRCKHHLILPRGCKRAWFGRLVRLPIGSGAEPTSETDLMHTIVLGRTQDLLRSVY